MDAPAWNDVCLALHSHLPKYQVLTTSTNCKNIKHDQDIERGLNILWDNTLLYANSPVLGRLGIL